MDSVLKQMYYRMKQQKLPSHKFYFILYLRNICEALLYKCLGEGREIQVVLDL